MLGKIILIIGLLCILANSSDIDHRLISLIDDYITYTDPLNNPMPYIKYLYTDINIVLDTLVSQCYKRSNKCNIRLFTNLYDAENSLMDIPRNRYYGRTWYPSINNRVTGNLGIKSYIDVNVPLRLNGSSSYHLDVYIESGYTIGIVREWQFIHYMGDGLKNTFHLAPLNYRIITNHCSLHGIHAPIDTKDGVNHWLLIELNKFRAVLEREGLNLIIH